MRHKSRERMEQIKRFSERFYQKNYRKPHISEIAAGTGLSKSTVHRYLNFMDEEGMIEYRKDAIVTDIILKTDTSVCRAAGISGVIPCGTPSEQSEVIDQYVPLPVAIFGDGDLFILRASGDSMTGAGIDSGDLVVLRRETEASEGDIVAALIDNHESTLKTYRHDADGRVLLHPENPEMDDIRPLFCEIQGVAVNVIKSLKS